MKNILKPWTPRQLCIRLSNS